MFKAFGVNNSCQVVCLYLGAAIGIMLGFFQLSIPQWPTGSIEMTWVSLIASIFGSIIVAAYFAFFFRQKWWEFFPG